MKPLATILLEGIEREENEFKAFLSGDERIRYEAFVKEGTTLLAGVELVLTARGNLAIAAAHMVARGLPQWTQERERWGEMRKLHDAQEKEKVSP